MASSKNSFISEESNRIDMNIPVYKEAEETFPNCDMPTRKSCIKTFKKVRFLDTSTRTDEHVSSKAELLEIVKAEPSSHDVSQDNVTYMSTGKSRVETVKKVRFLEISTRTDENVSSRAEFSSHRVKAEPSRPDVSQDNVRCALVDEENRNNNMYKERVKDPRNENVNSPDSKDHDYDMLTSRMQTSPLYQEKMAETTLGDIAHRLDYTDSVTLSESRNMVNIPLRKLKNMSEMVSAITDYIKELQKCMDSFITEDDDLVMEDEDADMIQDLSHHSAQREPRWINNRDRNRQNEDGFAPLDLTVDTRSRSCGQKKVTVDTRSRSHGQKKVTVDTRSKSRLGFSDTTVDGFAPLDLSVDTRSKSRGQKKVTVDTRSKSRGQKKVTVDTRSKSRLGFSDTTVEDCYTPEYSSDEDNYLNRRIGYFESALGTKRRRAEEELLQLSLSPVLKYKKVNILHSTYNGDLSIGETSRNMAGYVLSGQGPPSPLQYGVQYGLF